ncbi:VOC family protein [Streptomyces sp. NBC_00344]|uniref:VOC family protein n=1 Tax=Streptomyces sp. NBC_00344 TaxID=2975720 RepID=UPI002E230A41
MTVRRVVPDFSTGDMGASRDFYGLIGLREVMNQGWVMTLASPANPTAQLTFTTHDESAAVQPDLSIEVEDVDTVHAAVVAAGAEIVHPLQDEEWGVRRFFVRDPNGKVVNVVSHRRDG